ncbi:MAG: hypothetical protein ABSB22_19395 [Thermodesulfobacteriota bacterium]|jgi:hypothetical protein
MDIKYFLGYLAGLLTALIGIVVKHFLDKSRTLQIADKTRKQVACDKFRAAIAQEISLWHSCNSESGIRRSFFHLKKSSITAAIIEFRPFIKSNIEDYDTTHKAYEDHKRDSLSVCVDTPNYTKGTKLLKHLLNFAV